MTAQAVNKRPHDESQEVRRDEVNPSQTKSIHRAAATANEHQTTNERTARRRNEKAKKRTTQ